ncbi:hypothetical protein LZ198_25005 [Myxococcus sp. K15C18031901]|uniref:hypothetical protein n=1 Tax=Myxococcus dinghuensis TaxID=2906761 RepID=UPI0020A6E619|nr:hypothetical protein [Myxococcus dinghuensis]MCP3102132.1 hypothetical protein [Myxococcus dinghuensis]
MPRFPMLVAGFVLMLGACAEPKSGPEVPVPLKPPPASPPAVERAESADAGAPPKVDAGVVVDPSRLKEARALVPAPLLYGQLQPVVGTWVEYELRAKKGSVRARVAVVGESQREDGAMLYQLELDHETTPRMLVVVWVVGGERPFVERLAVSAPPHAPLSIPVDLYADQQELRGTLTQEQETQVREGSFAGRARQRTYAREEGLAVVVTTTPRVPLFGVESVRDPETTWVAKQAGTGAKPSLDMVPIQIPRLSEP